MPEINPQDYIVESTRHSKLLFIVIGVMAWEGFNPLCPNPVGENVCYICKCIINGVPKVCYMQYDYQKHALYKPADVPMLEGMGWRDTLRQLWLTQFAAPRKAFQELLHEAVSIEGNAS